MSICLEKVGNGSTDTGELFLPPPIEQLTEESLLRFTMNAVVERRRDLYSPDELKMLFDYHCGVGTMLDGSIEYYRQNYTRPLLRAVRAIFKRFPCPRVLDVGCGTATQSLLLALLGASVLAVDFDPVMLRLAEKRTQAYQRAGGRSLSLRLERCDARTADFSQLGQFDVVYSHGCLDHLDRPQGIFRRLAACIADGGLVVLRTSNPQSIWHLGRGRSPDVGTKRDFLEAARQHGFEPLVARGTTSFPKPLWQNGAFFRSLDRLLTRVVCANVALEFIFRRLG